MSVFNSGNERVIPANPERRPLTPAFQPPTPQPAFTPPAGVTQSQAQASTDPAARKPSVLGKTLVFKGELSADEDLVLQGRVEGSIHHTQSLTVGVDGVVIGDVYARSIVVEGTVEGDLRGTSSVLVTATAKLRGNIAAPRVGIMEGAIFNGSVDMSGAQAARSASDSQAKMQSADTGLSEGSVDRILGRA
jgi:cytoskeletal protein CcmA (bactofilin family)